MTDEAAASGLVEAAGTEIPAGAWAPATADRLERPPGNREGAPGEVEGSRAAGAVGAGGGGEPATGEKRVRVLLVGTDDWAVEQTAPMLEEQGCDVLRCHAPGEPAFPCNALIPGRTCPLDVGFEVVVTVRSRALNTLAQGEFGVVCALHNDIPLVVAGVGTETPFDRWTTRLVDRGENVASAARAASGVARR